MTPDYRIDKLLDRIDVLTLMFEQILNASENVTNNIRPDVLCEFEEMAIKSETRYNQRLSINAAAEKYTTLLTQIYELEADFPQLACRR